MPYGQHPANLALRFLLELAALIGMGRLGWLSTHGGLRWAWTLLIPGLAATVWGVCAVPGDPSRSGQAPVPVAGWLRLAIEAVFFAFGAWAYYRTEARLLAVVFTALALVHYGLSVDRVRWLFSR